MIARVLLFCLLLLFQGKGLTKSLGSHKLEDKHIDKDHYSFLAAGHIYGAPWNSSSIFPASSLLANLDKLRTKNASFFISMGDSMMQPDKVNVEHLKQSFIDQLGIPFFNAVGNHEVSNFPWVRGAYINNFKTGPLYFDFQIGTEVYLILDTDSNKQGFGKKQLEYIDSVLTKMQGVKNLFIISHKLFWSFEPEFTVVNQYGHSALTGTNFPNEYKLIKDKVLSLDKDLHIFFISGDLGTQFTLPAFYHQQGRISYIGIGIGDKIGDSVLHVELNKSEVTLSLVALTLAQKRPLESYNIAFWESIFKDQYSDKMKLLTKYQDLELVNGWLAQ